MIILLVISLDRTVFSSVTVVEDHDPTIKINCSVSFKVWVPFKLRYNHSFM